ncbi:MAG: nickel pincer cofactor biosynthesis protein LarC [candidate division NC10 bacterium]|nr:nickel pincer cofactor biosynthesis protein LarC [candidate division NC10 bacterium]
MRIAYFDCFSGISGDMTLGALVDAGLDLEELRRQLYQLPLGKFRIQAEKVRRGPLAGTKVEVIAEAEGKHHRDLEDILEIINRSLFPEAVKEDCRRIFTRLAEAEAKVHGVPVEKVHFHEVGALDSIVDVVGAALGIHLLGIEKIYASPMNLGSGFVDTEHGRLPVPAPGTLELVRGLPIYSSNVQAELTTPTGAAIISTLANGFGPLPSMEIERIGYGAGSRDLPELPNMLRVMVGEPRAAYQEDQVTVLEANLDDMNPQFFEPLLEELWEKGALDVYLSPIIMKKSRPATKLTVIAEPPLAEACASLILERTTTFGVRSYPVQRKKLSREVLEVNTQYGPVRVKVGRAGPRILHCSPEYEDCKRLARERGLSIIEVYREAERAAWNASRE